MMMPYRAPSVHHTDKLLPYGTVKERSIRIKCCSRGKMKSQGLIHSAFGYSGLKSIRGY